MAGTHMLEAIKLERNYEPSLRQTVVHYRRLTHKVRYILRSVPSASLQLLLKSCCTLRLNRRNRKINQSSQGSLPLRISAFKIALTA